MDIKAEEQSFLDEETPSNSDSLAEIIKNMLQTFLKSATSTLSIHDDTLPQLELIMSSVESAKIEELSRQIQLFLESSDWAEPIFAHA